MIKKVAIGVLAIIIIVVLSIIVYVNLSWQKDFSESFPVNAEFKAPSDSASITRGKYLAYGAAHCAHCHVPFDRLEDVEKGIDVPFTGGFGLEIPPGKFKAPNITPDPETGIGNKSDGEIYRMLRHNIRPNGMASIDFMPFINMSDEDIYSIIAYLRSTDPVKSEIINTDYSFMGKALLAMEVIKPGIPDEPIPTNIVREATVEYGRYLAYAVANCRGCHTDRDMQTGEYIGDEYAGGLAFGPDNLTNGWVFTTPNLTNDPETGHIYKWTEDQFVTRMKSGRIYDYSPMPWSAFSGMDTVSLRAVYRYLKSIEPVSRKIEVIAVAPAN
jgi:mono/diheme cytochrome c family protein